MLVKISVHIDPTLVARLAEAAEFLEVDFSDALAQAIEAFVDDLGPAMAEAEDGD